MNKTRVVILFGGRSSEHEISLLSARNVLLALDRSRYEPVLIAIDKQGAWRTASEPELLRAVGDPRNLCLNTLGQPLAFPPSPAQPEATASVFTPNDGADVVVFPVLHGQFGEDGTVQGFLELVDVPYVGAGVLGSAVAMDKDIAKRLVAHAGIPVVPWHTVRAEFYARAPLVTHDAVRALGYPVFVKPANAGSSVGVTRVRDEAMLDASLVEAFKHDDKALIETAIDAREIECAVLGNHTPEAAVPGEVIVTHRDGFYSYDAKYVDAEGAEVRIPADLPVTTTETLRALAVRAFSALELRGMARIDFFLDRKSGQLYFNEANTIPGFTAISMYPKMWEASGLGMTALISRLIELAREHHAERRRRAVAPPQSTAKP